MAPKLEPKHGRVANPEIRKLRAIQIIDARVKGETIEEIAAKLRIHPKTVKRELSWARKADLFIQYEDQLMEELIPLAHGALKTALAGGDRTAADVALELYKGTNILKKPGTGFSGNQQAEDDLQRYISQRRLEAQLAEDTEEGELLDGTEQRLIEAAGEGETEGRRTGVGDPADADAEEIASGTSTVGGEDCVSAASLGGSQRGDDTKAETGTPTAGKEGAECLIP